jgi:hypothetical protein
MLFLNMICLTVGLARYSVVDQETWKSHVGDDGRINDNYELRKSIFFGGLDPSLRQVRVDDRAA